MLWLCTMAAFPPFFIPSFHPANQWGEGSILLLRGVVLALPRGMCFELVLAEAQRCPSRHCATIKMGLDS